MTRYLLNKKKKGGFTLIELIIVIAIIAILAAVALPKFAAIRENANVKADISNAKNIQSEVISLIGEGTINPPTSGTTSLDASTDTNITNGMQNVPTIKSNKVVAKGTHFFVSIDNIGSVTIYAGDPTNVKEVYPNGTGDYANN